MANVLLSQSRKLNKGGGGGGGDPNKSAVGEGFFEKKNRWGGRLLGNRE